MMTLLLLVVVGVVAVAAVVVVVLCRRRCGGDRSDGGGRTISKAKQKLGSRNNSKNPQPSQSPYILRPQLQTALQTATGG